MFQHEQELKLIIDELESELDDLKNGNKRLNKVNNTNLYNNSGNNTNRLKQLSVNLNNTSLINHLKKENERLRKLVVTYEFKNKRFNEESQKKNKIKKNMININNHFYFSIINSNTTLNTKANTNSNSMITVNATNEMYTLNSNNSSEKQKNINNIMNKNNLNKNIIKEIKEKNLKKDNKIIKDIKNYNLINSNKSIDNNIYNVQKTNVSNYSNNNYYTKIINHNKKKRNNILNFDRDKKYTLLKSHKIINMGKESTSRSIQIQKNYGIYNFTTNLNNYTNLTNKKLKSKKVFTTNLNKSAIGYAHTNKKYEKELSKESRNFSRGLNNNHFNNSFNESLIDKKNLSILIHLDKTNQKNNYEYNQSMMMRTIENEKVKKKLQEKSLDISNDYIIIGKNSNVKEIKGSKKNMNNHFGGMDLSGQKMTLNKKYYKTFGNEFNLKPKINNLNNNILKLKNSNKKK